MQCDHAQEFFSDYVTNEMDHALAVTLENHLNTCRTCRETVEGLRQAWTTLDEMPTVDPPPYFHANIMEKISAEQAAEDRPLLIPRPSFSWRALFQPRTLAYAAVTLILLFGMEILQAQRASLGPLGYLWNVLHPTPLLATDRIEWTPNGLGGGTLAVHLRAHAQANGAENHLWYHLQLTGKPGQDNIAFKNGSRDGEIDSLRETVVKLPLDSRPSEAKNSLNITLSPSDNREEGSETQEIPLTPGQAFRP